MRSVWVSWTERIWWFGLDYFQKLFISRIFQFLENKGSLDILRISMLILGEKALDS